MSAALAALLTACGDDPVRPAELFEFVEADAVVRSAAALPSLGELAGRAPTVQPSQRATLVLAQQLWATGVASDLPTGATQRRAAAGHAAPVLAELLTDDDWLMVRTRAEEWMGVAETMLHHLTLPAVEHRIASARRYLERADGATSDDARVYHVLMALSELVETTPRFVARGLVADAAAAVRRAETNGAATAGGELDRARRLAEWAARAEEQEDHVRAIQRAYYAIQLVEGL
jgi:hypothetical protein